MEKILYYKQLERMANIGWWAFDLVTNELTWSDQTYIIHKIPIGKKIEVATTLEFYMEEDQAKIEKAFKNCIENREPYSLRLRIVDSQGDIVWVHAHGKPLIENDIIVQVFGTFQDITSQMQMRVDKISIGSELKRYKTVLDQFAIVAETDVHGKISYVNDKFCELSGYDKSELIGQNHNLLNSGEHSKEFFQEMWQHILDGKPWIGKICNKRKSGDLYWVETYITPIFNQKREILGFLSLRFDISDKVDLQNQIEKEKEIANFSSQLASLGEMSANIAHEIANPLTIIYGRNNVLLKYADDKEKLKITQESIAKAVERIQKIIKGLKRLSRKSQNEGFELVSLRTIVEETLGFSMESLKSHHIKLEFDEIEENVFVECREIELSQVLINLINNARDAILESESSGKWIKVKFVDEDDSFKLIVSDSGPGIPKENKDKVMTSFFTTKKMGKGTGLGLSLATRFIGEHNGQIYLDENAKNTTFVICLPKLQTIENVS